MILEDKRKESRLTAWQDLIVACFDNSETFVFGLLEQRIEFSDEVLRIFRLDGGVVQVNWMHHNWYIFTDIDDQNDPYFYVTNQYEHGGNTCFQDEMYEACCTWILSQIISHKVQGYLMNQLFELLHGPDEPMDENVAKGLGLDS